MLDAGKKRGVADSKALTIIGPGTLVTGEIKSKGTVHIEGSVSGRMDCEDTIVIQEAGRVKADLVAGEIIISGEVKGNVFANDRLEITANGRLIGDITAPRVSIAEGVLFEGSCTMKKPSEVATKPVAAAPEKKPAAPGSRV